MHILVLNAGSSTLKFRLFEMEDAQEAVQAGGIVDRVGTAQAELRLSVAGQPEVSRPVPAETPGQAAEQVITSLIAPRAEAPYPPMPIDVVAHRVVHGGARFVEPTRLTPDTLESLRALS